MPKREALLTLYGSLGVDHATRADRRSLFSRLTNAEYLSGPEDGETARKGGVEKNRLQPEVHAAAEVLAPDDYADTFDTEDHPILRVELLEGLVALASRHAFDDIDAFRSDPALNRMARPLVADPNDAPRLLEAIHQQRDSETLQQSQPQVIGGPETPGLSVAPPETSPSTLSHIQTTVAGQFQLADGLLPGVGSEPGVTCRVRLVPVSIGDEGAYALSFVTTLDPVELPDSVSPQDFVDALFEPGNWPDRHPFWCSMVEEQPDQHAPGAPNLMANMQQAATVATASGAQIRQRRVFREAVGTCAASDGQGTWPNTILVFTDSRRGGQPDGSVHHYLEYRLVPGASDLLSLDDGTIQVIEQGQSISITVTKMLFFNETEFSSQGELMAEYACVSGWAENTRLFLMSWLNDQ